MRGSPVERVCPSWAFSLPHKIDAEPQFEALLGILGQRL